MKITHRDALASGFTLLELVAVMSIMMLVIGLGFASFSIFDDSDPFEKPAERLSLMSKFALNVAVLQHRTMTIAFDKKGFGVRGADMPGGSYFTVPENMKVMVMRWGGKDWEKAEGHTWIFGEQGICEPIRVRLQTNSAGSRELAFHPLTGALVD
ncbi:pilus assembly FimT family protein [Prosthecobacter dejongeii]|uniref:Prepilin-type N-terminal cleavage/methylation domain-containing protein n=1 Tax=Prosthecobacter dejongeii TaxID=48465 RepID=A0A7W7YHB9_9BACT|nr:hypothetical protein [Prosthecobacter dejongeii]MBB5036119.1 hypothetical protein [Prosthecobacter dejongeii]